MAGILVRVERDLPDKETDDRRASDVLPRLGLSRAESSYHTRRRSWGVTQLAAVSAHGPWRRLEIEQSQPVSGEQSAAPTRSSAETAADAGVARGPGGAHQGCHGPGPAARAAASRGVPVMASKGGRMLSLACPRRALDPWRGPSSLGQRHRPAPVTPRKAPGLSRARQGPTPSRVHCGCQSAGVWSWMGRGPGPLSPAPPTAEGVAAIFFGRIEPISSYDLELPSCSCVHCKGSPWLYLDVASLPVSLEGLIQTVSKHTVAVLQTTPRRILCFDGTHQK
nr:uncharacterized protein LOC102547047 isoform X2 [Rattus norvegicus]XP_008766411.1 uncharacterized protein LOC102547047 isoform X2 [Rattus norvegicus]XP_038943317.1 uncharacterized protein LOC102547047 isoform X2 [Rattus norvegicus]|eukprot:XP_008766409.1 PREDICTED: uncharacterized protein LOC102547047 isoform X2 [Rattus norvegicus]